MTVLSREEGRALLAAPKVGNRGANGHWGSDGEWYASDAEEMLIAGLRQRQRIGEIQGLRRQKRFNLHALGGEYIGFAAVDAWFYDLVEKRERIQDAKGDRIRDTQLSDWKFKHIKAEYGIEVEIVRFKNGRKRVKPWK